MDIVRRVYFRSWRGLALATSLASIAYVLYFQRLGSLLPGYSGVELQAYASASNWHHLTSSPLNLPYTVPVWLLTAIAYRSIVATRIVAAGFGLAAGLLFFVIVRTWCTYRAAYLATVMFVASAGLLHFARLGSGDILQMGMLALLACTLWYRYQQSHRPFIGYCLTALFVLLLYIPGMIWFEVLGLFLLRATVQGQLRRAKRRHIILLSSLIVILLTPLAIAITRQPKLLLQVIGLPQSLGPIAHIGSRLFDTILGITIHSEGSPLFWTGHAPLLSAIEVVLGILGAYYLYRERPYRGLYLFGSLALGIALIAIGGPVTLACLVPVLYLFIANGLDNLLNQWMNVFPRNPVARATGALLICAMLLFSVLYQVRAYYVAWPHTPATRQTFNHPAP